MGNKLSIDDMRKIAKERGGECLSRKYINIKTKIKWRCKEGHEWEATPNNIKNNHSWCPYCRGNERFDVTVNPIKDIYEKYIKFGPEKVIEEWAKYKSKEWYDKGIITIELKKFLDNYFSVNRKGYTWEPGFYEKYRLFYPLIYNYRQRYIYGIKRKSRKKGKYDIQEIPLEECERCGNKKGLERHHIKPYSYRGDESPENIIVLCKSCHKDETFLFHRNERMKRMKNRNNR